jgi:hypothetical protein
MADIKISALPANSAVTPATDVLPIVHGGATEKITPQALVNSGLLAPGAIGGGTPGAISASTLSATGNVTLGKTITGAGTTGAQTINKTMGNVNFAAAAASLVVTNSLVATTSVIICTVAKSDTTMKSVAVQASAGSFTIYANAAPTVETRVNFLVLN